MPPDVSKDFDVETSLRKFFKVADTDKDGKVTKQELLTFFLKAIDHMAGEKALNLDSSEEEEKYQHYFLIEHCRDCANHPWHTRHNEQQYIDFGLNTRSAIKETIPHSHVTINNFPQGWEGLRLGRQLIQCVRRTSEGYHFTP